MKKKLIGIALILCMLLSFVPMAAFAEEPADGELEEVLFIDEVPAEEAVEEAIPEEENIEEVFEEIIEEPAEEAAEEPAEAAEEEPAEEAAEEVPAEETAVAAEPVDDSVSDVPANGSCGNGVYYDISGDNMRVYGNGAMTMSPGGNPVTLTVETGVTEICANAFAGYTRLTTVTIQNGVNLISSRAFMGCTALKTIRFTGNAPTGIDSTAFTNVVATVYYPSGNSTWNGKTNFGYGGTLTWQAEGSGPSPSQNGWVKSGSNWYYYENGKMITSAWRKDSKGLWYYLGSDGAMVTTAIIVTSGKQYYVGSDGAMVTNTTITYKGQQYAADANGVLTPVGPGPSQNGWVKNGRNWYYYKNGSKVVSAWVKSSSKWYYMGSDGAMVTNAIIVTNGRQYYVGSDGVMVTNTTITYKGQQ
ncbi:MAG: leucine-rich repeat protein, partial [Oscillospiraceae bacterium]|nr:leucine-rich repeat protein [Oscillospiraceae bacterium]